LKEWDYKNTGHTEYKLEYYTALVNLNLNLRPELPAQALACLLSECREKIWEEEYLKTLELNTCVLQYLFVFMQNRSVNAHFKPRIMQYVDSLLFTKVDEEDDDENFVWSEFFKFIQGGLNRLSKIESKYIATNCLQETLISTWISFLDQTNSFRFISVYKESNSLIEPKYLGNIWKLISLATDFIIKDKAQFASLPSYLQRKFIAESASYFGNQNIVSKIDLSKFYNAIEEDAVKFFKNSRENPSSSLPYLFFALRSWVNTIADNRRNQQLISDFLPKIFRGQLMEYVVSLYQERNLLSGEATIRSSETAESFVEFAIFVLSNIQNDAGFLVEDKNMKFVKGLIEDALNINTSLLSDRTIEALSSTLEKLYSETEILKKFEDYKHFFMFARYYISKPCLDLWEEDDLLRGVFGKLRNEEKAETLLSLFEGFLGVFERKVKDPSFDLDQGLRDFEVNREGIEESNSDEIKGERIIQGKTTFDSLSKTTMMIGRRVLTLTRFLIELFQEEQAEKIEKYTVQLKRIAKKTISLHFRQCLRLVEMRLI